MEKRKRTYYKKKKQSSAPETVALIVSQYQKGEGTGGHNGQSYDKKAEFLRLLFNNMGNIARTCLALNVARSQVYVWMEKNKKFRQAVQDIQEALIDEAETHLLHLIKSGDVIANIFYLKTKGKARGYVEKEQNTGENIKSITVNLKVIPVNKDAQGIGSGGAVQG